MRAVEALSSKRLSENQFEEITWNWDADSGSKVNSPLRLVFNAYSSLPRLPQCLSVLQATHSEPTENTLKSCHA